MQKVCYDTIAEIYGLKEGMIHMKKPYKYEKLKGFIAGLLVAVLFMSAPAMADALYQSIDVLVNRVQILINGQPADIDSLVYNGRTYVPLRAYSELLDKSVDYDDATMTVTVQDREQSLIMSKEIAFLVNGEAVRVSTFKQMLNWFKYNLELGEMDAQTYADFKEFVRQETVANYIVHQYAADAGIRMSTSESAMLKSQIDIYANNFGGMESFVKKLESFGVTYDFYYWLQETAVLRDKLTDIIIDPVTEEDISDYYQKNIALYATPLVTAKHIFLNKNDDTGHSLPQAMREEKKQLIEDILLTMQRGEANFDTLMHRYSEDPGLAAYPDGYTFGRGEMVQAFETAAFALQPGQMSGIVESELGFHILMVTKRETQYIPLESVKTTIYNSLRNERYYKFAAPQIQNAYILRNTEVYDSI